MMFDWQAFFDARGIDYATSGSNVGRGRIAIRCPFCGAADPSQHMSVDAAGGGWRCWRNHDHRGRSPIHLIRALIGCSHEEAGRIAGIAAPPASAGLAARVRDLISHDSDGVLRGTTVRNEEEPSALDERPEFRPLSDLPSARPFMSYLIKRGFTRDFLMRESKALGLRYAVRGPFGGRVVFLVQDGGRLVTWTGRTLSARQLVRYKELPVDPDSAAALGLPPAAVPLHSCLLWQDDLLRPRAPILCLVEGPVDALKLLMLGRGVVQPTAMFTNSLSDGQIARLRDAAPRFEKRVVLLDRGAESRAIRMRQALASLGFRVKWLPEGVDDPGELSSNTFAELTLAD